ncbi:hypothetical protein CVS40_11146 [Lucilia cuprina]|nr:hypothetical protein CVS40_11146 [Lucilia cuprina]
MPSTSRRSIKNTIIICGQCKLEVKEEKENSIECDKCGKIFHVICTKLDKRQYEQLLKNQEEEYVCHKCVNVDNSSTVGEELQVIKTQLKKLDQLYELQNTMNFMSSKFDEILKSLNENKKKIQLIEKENYKLKNEIITLKNSVKMLNYIFDQRVKNDCLISGVKAETEIGAAQAVINLSKNVCVDLEEANIEDAYFLKKKNSANPKQALVVKFSSKVSKDKLMAAKSKFKDNESTKNVFVNDYLSKESLELFNYAKTLKSIGYHSIFTTGGRIYARKVAFGRGKVIKCEEDVDNILLEATTKNIRMSKSKRQQEVPDEDSNCSDEEAQSQFMSPV